MLITTLLFDEIPDIFSANPKFNLVANREITLFWLVSDLYFFVKRQLYHFHETKVVISTIDLQHNLDHKSKRLIS
jgi:hypothetical protein